MSVSSSGGFKLFSEFYDQKRHREGKSKLSLADYNQRVKTYWKNMTSKQRQRYEDEAKRRAELVYSNMDLSRYTTSYDSRKSGLTERTHHHRSHSRSRTSRSRSPYSTDDEGTSVTGSYETYSTASNDDTLDDPTCCTSFVTSDEEDYTLGEIESDSKPKPSTSKPASKNRMPQKEQPVKTEQSTKQPKKVKGLTAQRKRQLEQVKEFAKRMRTNEKQRARREAMRQLVKKRTETIKRVKSRTKPWECKKGRRSGGQKVKGRSRPKEEITSTLRRSARVRGQITSNQPTEGKERRERRLKEMSSRTILRNKTQEHKRRQRRSAKMVLPIPLTKKSARTRLSLSKAERAEAGIKSGAKMDLALLATPIRVTGSETKLSGAAKSDIDGDGERRESGGACNSSPK